MKKNIKLCLVICIILVLSYFYSHIDKNDYLYDRNASTDTLYGTGVLIDGEEIRQTFKTEENCIDGINIKIATLGNFDKVQLKCSVIDNTSQVLSEVMVLGAELKNNQFNKLEIPTITETKGKQFTLVLSVENSDMQNGIGFYVEPSSYSDQELLVRGDLTEGAIVTRIISHRFDLETCIVFLGIITFVVGFMKVLYRFFK